MKDRKLIRDNGIGRIGTIPSGVKRTNTEMFNFQKNVGQNKMKKEKLRIAYIDRVPANKFLYIAVENLNEAMLLIDVLTKRDLFDDRVTDNCISLEVLRDEDWQGWENEDGEDIDVLMRNYKGKSYVEK